MSRLAILMIFSVVTAPVTAAPFQDDEQTVAELLQQANGQMQQQDFAAAAATFRKVVAKDKANARAWHLLGYALHASGNLDEAIKAHRKATEFPAVRGVALYNLGCAYSLQENKDRAFDFLNQAVRDGFTQADYFATDTDLDHLRADVRFKRLLKRVRGETVTDDFTAANLTGRWIVQSETVAGRANKAAAGSTVTVSKSKYVLSTPDGQKQSVDYKLDTSVETPTVSFAGSTGIMMMSGDRLTIAYTPQQTEAPSQLASTEKNGQTAIVLRRALTPARLAGQWEYVSGMRGGEKVPAERLVGVVTVTEKHFSMPAGPDSKFVMGYKLSNSGVHDAIDLVIEEGPVPKGSKAIGVIKVSADLLTLCYDGTGVKRPTGFDSTEDNAAFMFVLKRKSNAKPANEE